MAALGLIGLSVCVDDVCSMEVLKSRHPSTPLKREREIRNRNDIATLRSKVQRTYANNTPSSLPKEQEISQDSSPLPISSDVLGKFIDKELKKYPLPKIKVVRNDLLESGFLENMEKWIDGAINRKDINAMMVIGGLYYSNMDFDKAKPFIFWGAKENNGDAFWLLNCMWRKGELDNIDKALADALLIKAKKLGSTNAAIYLEEITQQ